MDFYYSGPGPGPGPGLKNHGPDGLYLYGSKKHFPYRGQRRFSYPVVRVHQNKLEVFERKESEVIVSFSKR